MKIVYFVNSLRGSGGVEAVTVSKANALARNLENDVWIIISGDDSLDSWFPVSDRVCLLGNKSINNFRFPGNIIGFIPQWVYLRKRLRVFLKQIDPDIVITTNGFERWTIPFIKGGWICIREYHFPSKYSLLSASSLGERIVAHISIYFDTWINNRYYDKIVVLTEENKKCFWRNNDKVCVIPNPIRFSNSSLSVLKNKRIVAIGRLVYEKHFSSLIRAFALVVKRFPEWRLDIFGEGDEKVFLSGLISRLSLEDFVHLRGKTHNVHKELLESSIFALSSRYEGLAMVLLEAMSCGLPVVSYDCPNGPREIITDGVDGFLVPEGNETLLAEGICRLIEDEEMRKRMGAAAYERSLDFTMDKIMRKWVALFKDLLKQKREQNCSAKNYF